MTSVLTQATLPRQAIDGHPSLADGLAMPHRRFISEGEIVELALEGHELEGCALTWLSG